MGVIFASPADLVFSNNYHNMLQALIFLLNNLVKGPGARGGPCVHGTITKNLKKVANYLRLHSLLCACLYVANCADRCLN